MGSISVEREAVVQCWHSHRLRQIIQILYSYLLGQSGTYWNSLQLQGQALS